MLANEMEAGGVKRNANSATLAPSEGGFDENQDSGHFRWDRAAALDRSVHAGGPPPKPERISITFENFSSPNSDPGTCDPSTYLPYAGDPACVYYEATMYTTTGDFVGSEFEEDSLVAFPNSAVAYAGYGNIYREAQGTGHGLIRGPRHRKFNRKRLGNG